MPTQKLYSATEIKEAAKERFKDDGETVTTYTYPVDVIWEGTEHEQVVTATVTVTTYLPAPNAEKKIRAFFEDPIDPHGAFVLTEGGDYGADWMTDADWIAKELRLYGLSDLLDHAGIEFDVATLDGRKHLYFDEDTARPKVISALLDRYQERHGDDNDFPDDPTFEDLREMW